MCFEYHKFRKPLGLEECESWAVIGGAVSRAIGGKMPRGGMGRALVFRVKDAGPLWYRIPLRVSPRLLAALGQGLRGKKVVCWQFANVY